MTETLFKELCKLGNEADLEYSKGRIEEAFESYNQIIGTMLEVGSIDSFLLSKATLGILLSFIMVKQIDEAMKIWTFGQESLYWIGIDGLENGQVSVRDTILYMQICAYLHSHSEDPAEVKAQKTSEIYMRISKFIEFEMPDWKNIMLSNWKLLLYNMFEGKIPDDHIARMSRFTTGEIELKKSVVFLQPSPWEITWDVSQ